jgi:tetratricopeptide (TPR) repeat protein
MKSILAFQLTLLFCLTFSIKEAFSQEITTPRSASPAASVTQTIGISTIKVDYSRPSVKGRQIWGSIVPYGFNKQGFGNNKEAPWRAGANENSVLTLSHAARIEGKEVPQGSYGLFFVVNQDNSGEVILSKDCKSWGSAFYEEKNDVMRAKIQLREIPFEETLTYNFINISKSSTELVLNWEKKQFPVKIEFAVEEIVLSNAENELKGPKAFTWQGNASAANYALLNNLELDKAMIWANQAIAQNKNFTTLSVKSRLLAKQGNKSEADIILKEAMAVSTEGELNTYGYQLLGESNFDEAIKIFNLNTKKYPNSANTWDSLGEAYALKGDKKNAIKHFKKSISLNPTPNVKANSEKYLKQLGAI